MVINKYIKKFFLVVWLEGKQKTTYCNMVAMINDEFYRRNCNMVGNAR